MGEKTQVANIWIFRLINDTLLELALSQFIPLRNKINKIGEKKKKRYIIKLCLCPTYWPDLKMKPWIS